MRAVTEQDFRKPEYVGKDPKDYEFNNDGIPVRKDRWETAIHHLRSVLGHNGRTFEIGEVIEDVEQLVKDRLDWYDYDEDVHQDRDEGPRQFKYVNLLLKDGSIIRGATVEDDHFRWFAVRFDAKTVKSWTDLTQSELKQLQSSDL